MSGGMIRSYAAGEYSRSDSRGILFSGSEPQQILESSEITPIFNETALERPHL
jgi:hypothetical protein